MSSNRDTAAKLNSTKELAAFLTSPKSYIKQHGGNPEDNQTARSFEQYARTLIENINAANRSVGISAIESADFGIGCGCCNKTALFK
jgi:hypothetical protein